MYFRMAESATEACCNPARLVDVIASSRLAMLGSFIASADGERPIAFANLMISGFLWCNPPKGKRQ